MGEAVGAGIEGTGASGTGAGARLASGTSGLCAAVDAASSGSSPSGLGCGESSWAMDRRSQTQVAWASTICARAARLIRLLKKKLQDRGTHPRAIRCRRTPRVTISWHAELRVRPNKCHTRCLTDATGHCVSTQRPLGTSTSDARPTESELADDQYRAPASYAQGMPLSAGPSVWLCHQPSCNAVDLGGRGTSRRPTWRELSC